MKKSLLKSLLCLFAVAAVAPDYASYAQDSKGLTRSIIINNGDTTVNGKKFSELDKSEKAKLREEFKEMEKNFGTGPGKRSEERRVVVGRGGDNSKDIIVTRDGKEPHVLYWNDDIASIGANVRSFKFDGKAPGEIRILKNGDDSVLINRDFQVFTFGGDSTTRFNLNTDSLLKRFNFNVDGLDSNIRKRVIAMNRNMVPGRPGRVLEGNRTPMIFEHGDFSTFGTRNNSSSFNYSHTDKDGISSRMNIRISDANKDQLKKITGTESIPKILDVSDLTLFPNFSSGKMTLSFNIASKGNTKISVLNSDMKSIFADEVVNLNGNYVKQLTLPKNGVYYVNISQNGSWFVKKLVKE
ncbi:T9SS type A sorting domain-containing protein [Daejeonella lutea]|uniref:Por secretion system C-terminal sorting domain-containing protein n=1 Tax=Daejeonella lutea TaxID=572036 RepID=A0A1T5DVA2_9SPHI|nr:T9SS type A sorting domain-containing protein [Daejeonella lutea]SKB75559.1 Por secretion system C-terminal sorting domain-containing protein [Daejeonella lutea]